MTPGPQRQIFNRPNGKRLIRYRDSNGEFISRTTYERLLAEAAESPPLPYAPQASLPTQSGRKERTANTGVNTKKRSEHHQKYTRRVEPENLKDHNAENATSALDDLAEFIKEERPSIHDFIHLNVELLKSRVQNNVTPSATPPTASNSTINESQPGATDNRSGGVNLSTSVTNVRGSVLGRDNIEQHDSRTVFDQHKQQVKSQVNVAGDYHDVKQNIPLDPDKEMEKQFQEIRGKHSYFRDSIEKHAQKAHLVGKRPTFVDSNLVDLPLHDLDCLHDADFCGSDLTRVNFSGSTLTRANLSGKNTNLTNVTMKKTNCEAANFDEAILDGIQMQNVDLRRATLRSTKLRGATLSNVNLERADLSGADLSRATLTGVCLQETNLDGIIIDNTTTLDPECRPVLEVACWEDPDPVVVKGSFRHAVLRGANFGHFNLTGSDFSHANLDQAKLHDACLHKATFEEANLEEADLRRAQLENAQLNNAYLGKAKLRRANLSNADLSNADLMNADLLLADLTNADLSRANLRNARVTQAQLDSAKSLSGAIMPDGSIHP